MALEPLHEKLHYFNGHGDFARRRADPHGLYPGSQILMLAPMLRVAGVPDSLHQPLFAGEVMAGVFDQSREEVFEDCLALPVQHGPLHLCGKGEQPPVLRVDPLNAYRIGGSPLKHCRLSGNRNLTGSACRFERFVHVQNNSTLSPRSPSARAALDAAVGAADSLAEPPAADW